MNTSRLEVNPPVDLEPTKQRGIYIDLLTGTYYFENESFDMIGAYPTKELALTARHLYGAVLSNLNLDHLN